MREEKLTKDSEKVLCVIYKEYLQRRKNGLAKVQAKNFSDFETWSLKLFPHENVSDLKESICEFCRAFDNSMYMNCGFRLEDNVIVYMENRFKNGLVDVVSFLAQFIP